MDEHSRDQAGPGNEALPDGEASATAAAGGSSAASGENRPSAAPDGTGTPGGTQQGDGKTLSMEERLAAAEAMASQHYGAYLRARADTENIRRRAQEDIVRAHKFALETFVAELLPVKDSLEATLAAGNASLESLRNGVELTLKQLSAAFEKSNLREINPVGEKFDPHRHQAISAVPANQEPNTVVTVLQKGYSLAERTIRPALVTVAKAKE